MNIIVSYAISLLYTIILYGAGPLVFLRLRKKPITRRRLKVFSVAYSFSAWFCSNLFWSLYDGSGVSTGGAAILWGGIFYAYMKHEFEKNSQLVEKMPAIPKERFQEQETNMGKFVVDTETGEVVKESNTACDHHEESSPPAPIGPEEPFQRKRQFPWTVCVLSCLCVAAMICAGWTIHDANNIQSRVETLEQENADLKLKNSNLEGQVSRQRADYNLLKSEQDALKNEKEDVQGRLDVTTEYGFEMYVQLSRIGFIVNGSKYYHHFECDIYKSAETYFAHNTEYCEYLGYSKCPKCWKQ